MRISDWSSDVCSSDLWEIVPGHRVPDQGTLCVAATDFSTALDRERCGVFHALGDEVEMMLRWPKRVAVCSSPRGQRCGSEERRVGNECVSTGRSRWWPTH